MFKQRKRKTKCRYIRRAREIEEEREIQSIKVEIHILYIHICEDTGILLFSYFLISDTQEVSQ